MENFDMSVSPGRTYKYFDGSGGAPLFPFGHGLSLTPLNLSCVEKPEVSSADVEPFAVTCDVTNLGTVFPGDEVVMAFHSVGDDVRESAGHPIPIQELVGFERVGPVKPGETATATLSFSSALDAFGVVGSDGTKTVPPGTHYLELTNGVDQVTTFIFEF